MRCGSLLRCGALLRGRMDRYLRDLFDREGDFFYLLPFFTSDTAMVDTQTFPCYLVANWKMSLSNRQSLELARDLIREAAMMPLPDDLHTWVAPSFLAIPDTVRALSGSRFQVGGQNLWPETHGAFTGEVSPSQLKEIGATFVIVGHSERRTLVKEGDDLIRRKVQSAIRHGLVAILCVGETREERRSGRTLEVLRNQLTAAIQGCSPHEVKSLLIAYEPVWAIGTGEVASLDQIAEAHTTISSLVYDLTHAYCPVLYGGSLKPENADSILALPSVHGGLVGGASLVAESFFDLIRAGVAGM